MDDPWASAYPANWGGRVRLRLGNGSELTAERTDAKGDPEAPLSRNEMIEKAAMLLRHGGIENPKPLIDAILGLAASAALPDLALV